MGLPWWVLIGGGAAAYFVFFRKKDVAALTDKAANAGAGLQAARTGVQAAVERSKIGTSARHLQEFLQLEGLGQFYKIDGLGAFSYRHGPQGPLYSTGTGSLGTPNLASHGHGSLGGTVHTLSSRGAGSLR